MRNVARDTRQDRPAAPPKTEAAAIRSACEALVMLIRSEIPAVRLAARSALSLMAQAARSQRLPDQEFNEALHHGDPEWRDR